MAKEVSPGVKALRKVVEDVYADARKAHAEGKLVGWSSSKFPCELAEAFDLNVMYPENQAAGRAGHCGHGEPFHKCARERRAPFKHEKAPSSQSLKLYRPSQQKSTARRAHAKPRRAGIIRLTAQSG